MSMRAGVVGAGAAGLLHALSYRAHGVAVSAVFDPVADKARVLAEMCGAAVCGDLAVLAQSDVDCVSVCSRPVNHVDQALVCARDGRIVFIEKPVAVSRPELARLLHAPGCVPIVQWRWGRAVRAVRRAIALGMLGRAPSVSLDLAWHRDAAYFRARSGWGCGALLSVGIHALDAACFALDRPVVDVACARRALTGVQDGTSPATPERGRDDEEASAVLLATFEGGAIAALRLTLEGGPDQTRLSFCGGGVMATIVGTEADPTASAVVWSCSDAMLLQRLVELEQSTDGSLQGPLIVPFLGRAIDARRRGALPGQCDALPSIHDVFPAHDLAMRACEGAHEF
jgi:predicted dehydrogenase